MLLWLGSQLDRVSHHQLHLIVIDLQGVVLVEHRSVIRGAQWDFRLRMVVGKISG